MMPEDKVQEALTDEQVAAWAAWALQTCLMFGASTATAYQVAGLLAAAIRGPDHA